MMNLVLCVTCLEDIQVKILVESWNMGLGLEKVYLEIETYRR